MRQLRRGYSPLGTGPKKELNDIYNNVFKPLLDKNDLDFFFELFETKETRLRAWGFLGISQALKDKTIDEDAMKSRFHKIISELLNDRSEIVYYGGSLEIRTSIREHHVRRLCDLDESLIFEPVFEYVQASEGKMDNVIGELLENNVSKILDSRIEPIIIHHAKNVNLNNQELKIHIINAFGNLDQTIELNDKKAITEIFRSYLENIDGDKTRKFHENLFKVATIMDLALENETLEFLGTLTHPYHALYQIANKYKNNNNFKSILLNKVNESENSLLIKDILRAILVMKENVQNWRELVIENLNKFQIIDGDLMEEMQENDLFNEEMIIEFFIKGDKWNLEFIREFLINNPEKLNEWLKLKDEFIKVLTSFKSLDESWDDHPNLKEKKELTLKLLLDLERKDMVEYSLENYKNLDDGQLRKIALFIIIKFGKDELLLELKKILDADEKANDFFKKFWREFERRDRKFFY